MLQKVSWQLAGCLLLVSFGLGQTFEINGQGSTASNTPKKSRPAKKGTAPSADTGMGWGSSIEVARQARAAQQALDKGNYRGAADFAERAAKVAPQNSDFWFLLGYSARLAGRYPTSVDAYNRGLALRPSSIQGLSGLAQTYARMGQNDKAKALWVENYELRVRLSALRHRVANRVAQLVKRVPGLERVLRVTCRVVAAVASFNG